MNDSEIKKEKCIVCGIFMGTGKSNDSDAVSLKELKDLCEASGAEVVGEASQNRDAYDARTVIGKGKVEEIKNAVVELNADTVVFDCELSGSHTRNLEEEFGVSAAAMAVAAPAGGAAPAAAAEEEKSEYTVVLKDVGANKINVIKVIRDVTGLGLSESKALADNVPSTIKENVATEAAKEMVEKFKAAGATAELK